MKRKLKGSMKEIQKGTRLQNRSTHSGKYKLWCRQNHY